MPHSHTSHPNINTNLSSCWLQTKKTLAQVVTLLSPSCPPRPLTFPTQRQPGPALPLVYPLTLDPPGDLVVQHARHPLHGLQFQSSEGQAASL